MSNEPTEQPDDDGRKPPPWTTFEEPPPGVHAARVWVAPVGSDEWTELEGVTDVTLGTDGSKSDDEKLVAARPVEATVEYEVSEEDRNEIAAMTDAPVIPPNRLIYASDVVPGMRVLYARPCPAPHGFLSMMAGGGHDHGQALADVLQVRQGEGAMGHIFSAIVLDEAGVQQSMTWHSVEAVRIAV